MMDKIMRRDPRNHELHASLFIHDYNHKPDEGNSFSSLHYFEGKQTVADNETQ